MHRQGENHCKQSSIACPSDAPQRTAECTIRRVSVEVVQLFGKALGKYSQRLPGALHSRVLRQVGFEFCPTAFWLQCLQPTSAAICISLLRRIYPLFRYDPPACIHSCRASACWICCLAHPQALCTRSRTWVCAGGRANSAQLFSNAPNGCESSGLWTLCNLRLQRRLRRRRQRVQFPWRPIEQWRQRLACGMSVSDE